jgi:hypothetical protein
MSVRTIVGSTKASAACARELDRLQDAASPEGIVEAALFSTQSDKIEV